MSDLKCSSWNIAAVNNNPFEYWITHPGKAAITPVVQECKTLLPALLVVPFSFMFMLAHITPCLDPTTTRFCAPSPPITTPRILPFRTIRPKV